MMVLPREISKAIRKKKTLRIVLFAVATLFISVILVLWGDTIFALSEDFVAFKYSCYAVLLILPLFFTKVYLVFTDTNYFGEVKKVNVVSVVDSKSSIKPSLEQLYNKNEVHLTIEDPHGRILKKKVYETPSRLGAGVEMYKVGDQVLHLHSTAITIVLPTSADARCCCSMCGWSNDKHNDRCSQCGLPLITSIES